MTDWDTIKNNIAELNGNNKLSPIDNKPLDNELIMCLFCNKVNLKYRFEPYYEVPFIEYTTRIFESILGYDESIKSDKIVCKTVCKSSSELELELEDSTSSSIIPTETTSQELSTVVTEMQEYFDKEEQKNFFEVAKKEPQIKIYIDSIKNVILTQIRISVKKNPDIIKEQNIDTNKDDIYDTILNNVDVNLLLVSALENLDMRKYKILSKMLYNQGNKYLDYAKESIINSNKNISLDKMVYGIDLINIEHFNNINVNSNNLYLNLFLILIIIIIVIMINYSRT